MDMCETFYCPEPNGAITVDEIILGFSGKLSFKIYIPSKSDQWGIKIHCANDSTSHYLIKAKVYLGKEVENESGLQVQKTKKSDNFLDCDQFG